MVLVRIHGYMIQIQYEYRNHTNTNTNIVDQWKLPVIFTSAVVVKFHTLIIASALGLATIALFHFSVYRVKFRLGMGRTLQPNW